MSTSWTWDHQSSPSAVRPSFDDEGPDPGRLGRAWGKARLRARQLRHVGADCRRELRETRVDALTLVGAERHSAQQLRCLYVGARENLAYLKRLLFADEPTLAHLCTSRLLGVRGLARRYEAGHDVVAIDVDWPWDHLLPEGEYLRTPCWINQRLDISSTWHETSLRLQNEVKRNHARRAKKYGLAARVTRDEATARRFYREMYLPHIRRKFGEACIVEDEESLVSLCRAEGLLEVTSQGEVLGAAVLQRSGDRQKGVWIAVRGGLDNALTGAVFGAIYYYTIVYAYEHGCSVMDFCASRAALNDGVLSFKRKWGARVQRGERDALLLKPLGFSASTVSFFVNNPLLVRHEGGLAARILSDQPLGGAQLRETVERYDMDGIELYDVCSTRGFEPAARKWAQENPRLRLRDLGHTPDPAREFCRP